MILLLIYQWYFRILEHLGPAREELARTGQPDLASLERAVYTIIRQAAIYWHFNDFFRAGRVRGGAPILSVKGRWSCSGFHVLRWEKNVQFKGLIIYGHLTSFEFASWGGNLSDDYTIWPFCSIYLLYYLWVNHSKYEEGVKIYGREIIGYDVRRYSFVLDL